MTSEKKDKRFCNRKIHHLSKIQLQNSSDYIEPKKQEIIDRWDMPKDRS